MRLFGISVALRLILNHFICKSIARLARFGHGGKKFVIFSILFGISFQALAVKENDVEEYKNQRADLQIINSDYAKFREFLQSNASPSLKLNYTRHLIMIIESDLTKETRYAITPDQITARLSEILNEMKTAIESPCSQLSQNENFKALSQICKDDTSRE